MTTSNRPGRTTRFFLLGAQIDRAIDRPGERADDLARARTRRRRLGHAGPAASLPSEPSAVAVAVAQ